MSVQAKAVPRFSGKNQLSLQDLDSLADAVQAHNMAAEYVPAGVHHGRRQYTGANYNLALFVDECNGETATPDKSGIISSVQYLAVAEPYIDSGNIVLPLAHDYDPAEDSSIPTEQATGGVAAISVGDRLRRPQIDRGSILLPLAHSDWGDAEGAMRTPGLVEEVSFLSLPEPNICQGVVYIPYADGGCDGVAGVVKGVKVDPTATDPEFDAGVLVLPPLGGGGGGGGISSCSFSSPITQPTVRNNQLLLPYAEQTNDVCQGMAYPYYTAGVMKHISFAPDECNACGYYPWIEDGACYIPTPIVALGGEDGRSALCNHLIDCEYAPITLSSCRLPDGTMLYLQGWTERNGQQLRLKITTENAYYY